MGVALLLMLCSGLFLAAWITLMNTRAIQVSWLEEAVQRRISLENSRLISWQTAMDFAFDPKKDLAGKTALLKGGKAGGLDTLAGWKKLPTYSVTGINRVPPFNQTGLRPGSSYYLSERFTRPTMPTGVNLDEFDSYQFIKTHCPIVNGDLVVIYRKPDRYPANSILDVYKTTAPYRVEGRVVVRHPPSLFANSTSSVTLPMLSKSLYIQSHEVETKYKILGSDINGKPLMPSNLAAVPSTSGPNATANPQMFEGYLNVINNAANPDNSLLATMGSGSSYHSITVFDENLNYAGCRMQQYYDKPPLPPPDFEKGGYDIPYKTLYVNLANLKKHLLITCQGSVVDQIVFEGQTTASAYDKAGLQTPVIVTLRQGTGQPVRNIVFKGESNRRLILGIQKLSSRNDSAESFNDREVVFSWAGDPLLGRELRWRMALINEGHNILLNLHSNTTYDIRWIGGVMTNWSFRRNPNSGVRAERLTFQSDKSVPPAITEGTSYESMLPRDGWVESYFLPQSPP